MAAIEELTRHPELTAMTPLLYVAWADGALEAEEIRAIREAARARLPSEQHASLDHWLDPDAPPSSTELLRLYRFVRDRAGRLDAKARSSLVDLGCAIASLEGDLDAEDAKLRALEEVEAALGIQSREVARHFFEERPPVRQDFDEPAPPFDVAALTALLDGDAREDWERIRGLVTDPRLALAHGLPTPEYRARIFEQLKVLTEEGIGALSYPEAHGGGGLTRRFVKSFEALGMHDLSLVVKLGVQFGLFGGAIANLGSERHHATLLPAIGRGELLGGFAMTELGHGSNVRDLETVARYDVEQGVFVLHTPSVSARKEWIGNAALHGRAMAVFAQLETGGESHGVHVFYVPIRDEEGNLLPGVSVEDCGHKMGLNGVDNGRLWFDHVQVPRENLLDRYASVAEDGTYDSPIANPSRRFFTMLGTLVGGRISVGAAAVTASKVSLATAIRYGALRRQFGPEGQAETSVLDYPAHQQRLMPWLASAYAHHFTAADLQRRWAEHEGEDTREIEALAAGVKALATWHGIDACQAARECCGGMGFLTLNRISQMRRDVDVFATFEGDNTVLLQLVAKSLLTGFAKQLSDNLIGTLLSEIGERAKRALIEQNPVNKRRTDDEHLKSVDFHRDALRYRTHNLLVSAARRMKKRTDADMDPFDAFTEVQDHLVALARAHVEEHVHACFADAVDAAEGAEREALESLRALFAIWRLHDDVGWYLENDYLDGRKARALRKLFGRQCAEVRRHSVALVNAFGIPDAMLGPVAFEGYAEHAMLA
ncbi:MAG: acyl-CoA dehydrogenase [Myxococcota bacterium]|nr:acyl-CoA dehydrogenase [Myxococcota bacterium]